MNALNQNQIRINGMNALGHSPGMNALMAFTGYEVLMHFQINGIYACGHRPGYEARVGFTGHSPPTEELNDPTTRFDFFF